MLFFKKLLQLTALTLFIGTLSGQKCIAADVFIPSEIANEINDAQISDTAKKFLSKFAQNLIKSGQPISEVLQQVKQLRSEFKTQETSNSIHPPAHRHALHPKKGQEITGR